MGEFGSDRRPQVPLSVIEVVLSLSANAHSLRLIGIIIASWAHNLCKSHKGLTLSTVSLVSQLLSMAMNMLFMMVRHAQKVKGEV